MRQNARIWHGRPSTWRDAFEAAGEQRQLLHSGFGYLHELVDDTVIVTT
jgi:hypothetical protein